jgi:hypothetical protein
MATRYQIEGVCTECKRHTYWVYRVTACMAAGANRVGLDICRLHRKGLKTVVCTLVP